MSRGKRVPWGPLLQMYEEEGHLFDYINLSTLLHQLSRLHRSPELRRMKYDSDTFQALVVQLERHIKEDLGAFAQDRCRLLATIVMSLAKLSVRSAVVLGVVSKNPWVAKQASAQSLSMICWGVSEVSMCLTSPTPTQPNPTQPN
jgi:hypothetical protein